MLKVGDKAPDFSVNDQDGNPVKLSDFRCRIFSDHHPGGIFQFGFEDLADVILRIDLVDNIFNVTIFVDHKRYPRRAHIFPSIHGLLDPCAV